MRTIDGKMRAIQFHPEVVHTPSGAQILRNFVLKICGEPGDWTTANIVETKLAEDSRAGRRGGQSDHGTFGRRRFVGSRRADSSRDRRSPDERVCRYRALARGRARADGKCLRAPARDRAQGRRRFQNYSIERLAGVLDPEQKRRIIGHTFIEVFDQRGAGYWRCEISRAGHALSRRDRVGLVQGTVGRYQEPSQCWWASRIA